MKIVDINNQLKVIESGVFDFGQSLLFVAAGMVMLGFAVSHDGKTPDDSTVQILLYSVGGIIFLFGCIWSYRIKRTTITLTKGGSSEVSTKRFLGGIPEIQRFDTTDIIAVKVIAKKKQLNVGSSHGTFRYRVHSVLFFLLNGDRSIKIIKDTKASSFSAKIDSETLMKDNIPLIRNAVKIVNYLGVPLQIEGTSNVPKRFRKFMMVE